MSGTKAGAGVKAHGVHEHDHQYRHEPPRPRYAPCWLRAGLTLGAHQSDQAAVHVGGAGLPARPNTSCAGRDPCFCMQEIARPTCNYHYGTGAWYSSAGNPYSGRREIPLGCFMHTMYNDRCICLRANTYGCR